MKLSGIFDSAKDRVLGEILYALAPLIIAKCHTCFVGSQVMLHFMQMPMSCLIPKKKPNFSFSYYSLT